MTQDLDSPIRADVLHDALKLTLGDRNEAYGDPFTNMQNIACLWSAYLESKYTGLVPGPSTGGSMFCISAEDVAHFNTPQKIARHMNGPARKDNYVDAAAYQAIAAECALEDRE